jgi:hypothetical protein
MEKKYEIKRNWTLGKHRMDRYLDTLAENELEIHKHVCIALENQWHLCAYKHW